MLRSVTRLSHAKGRVNFGERSVSPVEKRFVRELEKLVMVPEFGRRRHRLVEERTLRLAALAETTDLNREIPGESGEPGIIAAGIAYQYAREAFPRASFLKIGMTWPLPRKRIEEFAARHARVIVVEELDPFIEEQVRAWGIAVEGAAARSLVGELNPDARRRGLGRRGGPGRRGLSRPIFPDAPPCSARAARTAGSSRCSRPGGSSSPATSAATRSRRCRRSPLSTPASAWGRASAWPTASSAGCPPASAARSSRSSGTGPFSTRASRRWSTSSTTTRTR